jgi:hypothetical protein
MVADVELLETIGELAPEERRVLLVLARRLLVGQRAYGRLDLVRDRRDWHREAAEEAADLAIYSAIGIVADEARREARASAPALDDDDEPSRGDLVIVEVDRAVG